MKPLTAILLFSGMIVFSASCIAGQGGDNISQDNLVNPQRIVSAHNGWREKVGVVGLKWSPILENKAIVWANELKENNGCRMKHSGPGENLYWASAFKTATKEGDGNWQWQSRVKEVGEQQVVDSWGSEIQWYSYESNSCNAPTGESCGHYTQLVWEGTTEVGCAKALCPDNSQVWVCNYASPGNIIGQRPY
jgi:pathogenesis-related protein 1